VISRRAFVGSLTGGLLAAPLALPGLIATSIFTFPLAWNDYIFTRILIVSDEFKTLPVGV